VNAPFLIVRLQEGTQEWREWRHKGIGASDAPVIMGESRLKNVAALLQEKCGPARDFGRNDLSIRGTELEAEARERYTVRTGRKVTAACIQSTRHDWLRASVDGLSDSHDSVVEITCGESIYRRTANDLRVPEYCFGQLQHIMAVTGFESIDFWCCSPACDDLLLPVQRDSVYIERLLHLEQEFWNHVVSRRLYTR
jgi:putative phage-type endonuclease